MREQAKTPESSFQRAYLRQKKREREQVRVFRALLLVSFLVLWEAAVKYIHNRFRLKVLHNGRRMSKAVF